LPAPDEENRLEWARWAGQAGERESTVEPGFRRMEAHGQARTHNIEFKRQVAQEFLAGETLTGSRDRGCVKAPQVVFRCLIFEA
jgi:hypothetical protein